VARHDDAQLVPAKLLQGFDLRSEAHLRTLTQDVIKSSEIEGEKLEPDIHPFDDGTGRIARAIADMALARSERTGQRFYSMSAQPLRKVQKKYFLQIKPPRRKQRSMSFDKSSADRSKLRGIRSTAIEVRISKPRKIWLIESTRIAC